MKKILLIAALSVISYNVQADVTSDETETVVTTAEILVRKAIAEVRDEEVTTTKTAEITEETTEATAE